MRARVQAQDQQVCPSRKEEFIAYCKEVCKLKKSEGYCMSTKTIRKWGWRGEVCGCALVCGPDGDNNRYPGYIVRHHCHHEPFLACSTLRSRRPCPSNQPDRSNHAPCDVPHLAIVLFGC